MPRRMLTPKLAVAPVSDASAPILIGAPPAPLVAASAQETPAPAAGLAASAGFAASAGLVAAGAAAGAAGAAVAAGLAASAGLGASAGLAVGAGAAPPPQAVSISTTSPRLKARRNGRDL